jgi:hypothetical protein
MPPRVTIGVVAALLLAAACGPGLVVNAAGETDCDNGLDDDGDGRTDCDDPDCAARCGLAPVSEATRDAGTAAPADARPMADSGSSPPVGPGAEVCGNGLDDNGDGRIDESCPCSTGATQPCYPGDAARAGVGQCAFGQQTCIGEAEFAHFGDCVGAVLPSAEVCDGRDNDCDGIVDNGAGCVSVPVDLDGDCLTVSCPPQAPYPVGCAIVMEGDDSRGCVASTPSSPDVYFQEGDECGLIPAFSGHVSGQLLCSTQPGAPLTAATCPINKSTPLYPPTSAGCP